MTVCLPARPDAPAPPLEARDEPAGSRFNHVTCLPTADLAPFVEHYWVTRWDRRGHVPRTASSLLDPCVHLQVRDGRAEVVGVVRGAYHVRIADIGCIVGARFRPGGFYPFVKRPVIEWTDRTAPAEATFGGPDARDATWSRELTSAVLACAGDAAAHAAIAATHLDAFLRARLPERDATAEEVAELVALIAGSAELRRVGDLVRASGRSERTLHRLFARYVGASPSWVIRRYRLHAAARRLTASPPEDVRQVAWDLGYADQAHFIRDFRATIGVAPGAYVRDRG